MRTMRGGFIGRLGTTALCIGTGACAANRAPVPAPPPFADAADPGGAWAPDPGKPLPRPAAMAPVHRRPAAKRVTRPDSAALERVLTARLEYHPLARAQARRTGNPEVASRAAMTVMRESRRLRLSPSLLGAVLLTENGSLDSAAVSSQGAVGLMQVMPVHAGSYGCASSDLREVEANICHGARLLHRFLRRSPSVQVALRRYNGCVRGSNTPRCARYPGRVLRVASALRREMLVGVSAAAARPSVSARTRRDIVVASAVGPS
jgi:soluble lytic murein transglycosylase-like protein